jgi:hypothetical protein
MNGKYSSDNKNIETRPQSLKDSPTLTNEKGETVEEIFYIVRYYVLIVLYTTFVTCSLVMSFIIMKEYYTKPHMRQYIDTTLFIFTTKPGYPEILYKRIRPMEYWIAGSDGAYCDWTFDAVQTGRPEWCQAVLRLRKKANLVVLRFTPSLHVPNVGNQF